MGIKFDIINHYFMLEYVDSCFYFVQDENNFINHRYRYDPDPDPLKKVLDTAVPKSTDPTGSGS